MSNTVLNPLPNAAIILRGVSIPLASDVGGAFITDCARNREKLLSDQQICEKFGITFEALTEIGANKAVRLAVNAEHQRRLVNGDAAREAAAKLFAEAPEVLGTILRNEQASPRHRIEAARELRTTANHGAEKTSDAADRVVVHINLGNDKLVIDSGPLKQNEARNLDGDME
jgi:hypothetical protein